MRDRWQKSLGRHHADCLQPRNDVMRTVSNTRHPHKEPQRRILTIAHAHGNNARQCSKSTSVVRPVSPRRQEQKALQQCSGTGLAPQSSRIPAFSFCNRKTKTLACTLPQKVGHCPDCPACADKKPCLSLVLVKFVVRLSIRSSQ